MTVTITRIKRRGHQPVRVYCPGCGEVRALDRLREPPRVFAHWTGSPYTPPQYGQRYCPGGHPDLEKDLFR
jgi:hypothetical protein